MMLPWQLMEYGKYDFYMRHVSCREERRDGDKQGKYTVEHVLTVIAFQLWLISK